MNILKSKRFLGVLLAFLMFIGIGTYVHVYIYAQEKPKQSELQTLEQVKSLLDEGLKYLEAGIFDQAKYNFEEALKIAPKEMTEEIKNLISRTEDIANKKKGLTEETIVKGEKESKKITELQQDIIQFEKGQKKKAYTDKGKSYYDQGKYEEALVEFNKILTIEPNDKDAIAYIEKTQLATEKSKDIADRRETLTRIEQVRKYRENAKSYYRGKRYDDAINELKKILAIDPTDTDAIEYMELMEEMKLFGAKIGEAERLEDMVNKGKQYLRDKDYDKAIEIWKQVLKEKADYPGIEVLIAQAEFAKTKGEQKVVGEKQKTEKEKKLLEIDEAYVPVIGGVKEEKKEKTAEDEELLAIEEITKKAKEKKISLEFTDADLRSVVLFLSKQSGINMMFDEAIFETGVAQTVGATGAGGTTSGATGSGGSGTYGPSGPIYGPGSFPGTTSGASPSGGATPGASGPGGAVGGPTAASSIPVRTYNVTVSLRDMSLLDALSLILRSRGLDYEIRPNVIWISTRDRIVNIALETLETRVFDIQFGGPIRGQLRPQPLKLETITFGETQGSGGGSGGGGGSSGGSSGGQ